MTDIPVWASSFSTILTFFVSPVVFVFFLDDLFLDARMATTQRRGTATKNREEESSESTSFTERERRPTFSKAMFPLWERMLSVVLSSLGLGVSLYMVSDHFNVGTSICDMGSRISCSLINKGAFSELLHVPISVLGVWWFIALTAIILLRIKYQQALVRGGGSDPNALEKLRMWVLAEFWWNLSGILFVFYLVGVEAYLGVLCPFCTVIHIITVITTIVAWRLQKRVSPAGILSPFAFFSMKPVRNFGLSFGVCVLLTTAYFNTFPGINGPSMINTEFSEHAVDQFAQCLANRGFRMYGSLRCGFCMRQKALFGESFEHIHFIDCDGEKPTECDLKGVDALPTWIQWIVSEDGETLKEVHRLQGMQSFENLQDVSKCELMN
jgi:uncharacterized membrane protein